MATPKQTRKRPHEPGSTDHPPTKKHQHNNRHWTHAHHKPPVVPLPSPLPDLPPLPAGELATAPFQHASRFDAKYDTLLNYERLEFYGDAEVELFATKLIFHTFPKLQPGRASQLRESLVRNTTLATYAKAYGFGERLDASGDALADKVLADTFEAYVAAVCLASDDGEAVARAWVDQLWQPLLRAETSSQDTEKRNWKQELHEALVGYGVKVEYREQGRGANQDIEMAVVLNGWGFEEEELGRAVGQGKIDAGMKAARDAFTNKQEVIEVAQERRRVHLEKRRKEKEGA